jgi:hypothetical protein
MNIPKVYEGDVESLEKWNLLQANRVIIPLGGWCGVANQTREVLKINVLALPFDYLVSTFNAVINSIQNDFSDFFDKPKKIQVGPDMAQLTSDYFYWIHHDISNEEVRDAFNSRTQRFMNLINCEKDVIFVRSCTENITEELKCLDNFYKMINTKTNLKSWKLLLITQNYNVDSKEHISLKMNINNEVYVFCINGFPKESNLEPGVEFVNYPVYINYNLANIIHKFLLENENELILQEWTDEEKNAKPYENGYTGNTYDSHTLQFMSIIDTATPIL